MTRGRGIEELPNSSELLWGAGWPPIVWVLVRFATMPHWRSSSARVSSSLVGGRAQRLLAHLLARRGEIVSKADLIDAAWPGQAIEESNLSVQIAQLRKLIGAEWIRTVERVGYQFVPGASRGHIRVAVPVLAVPPFSPGDEVALAVHTELHRAPQRFSSVRGLGG